MKVLIADDSKLMRDRIHAVLSDIPGVEIIGEVDDGPKAVRAVDHAKPDVVILDIRMPGGNGIGALQAIKDRAGAPLAVMLTNFPYPQYRKKCLDLGAEYFLDKSSEFDQIASIFKKLIARHS